jgi:hypothetical protein
VLRIRIHKDPHHLAGSGSESGILDAGSARIRIIWPDPDRHLEFWMPDPDPQGSASFGRIRIRIKMIWIRNTA